MEDECNRPVSREQLLFAVEMALFQARGLWPKRRDPGDHDRLKPMARAIVDDLERSRIRCVQLPPIGAASASDLCPELRRDALGKADANGR